MERREEILKKERRSIFFIIFLLTLFGTLMIYESSSLYAYKMTEYPAYFFQKQLIFLSIGLGLFFLVLFLNLDFLRKHNKELLILTLILLGALLIWGTKKAGARRWFYFFGFNFQPSELLKISFLIYCADYLVRKKSLIRNFAQGLLPLWLILGVISVFLILQPDLGSAIFWMIWVFILLFLHRAKKKHLFLVALCGIVACFFLIKLYPYRFRRIMAYFNPFSDPEGAGFQLIQSQIAYGEGGILGVGLGSSRQKLSFLPAAHTDFIFSIIAEEFGLWGSLGLLSIFFILFHKMLKVAKMIDDAFRKNILWGITFILGLEIIINIGVSCGFFPTKGLPLPFISYGGSSLVIHYVLLGLFFNASRKHG